MRAARGSMRELCAVRFVVEDDEPARWVDDDVPLLVS
jgi:hypothetical protein